MSLSDRQLDEAVMTHMQATLEAHRAWQADQVAIATEYEQRAAQLAAWRIEAMADADSRYRAAHGVASSQLVTQQSADVTRALEAPRAEDHQRPGARYYAELAALPAEGE
jgi:hypothetical protein